MSSPAVPHVTLPCTHPCLCVSVCVCVCVYMRVYIMSVCVCSCPDGHTVSKSERLPWSKRESRSLRPAQVTARSEVTGKAVFSRTGHHTNTQTNGCQGYQADITTKRRHTCSLTSRTPGLCFNLKTCLRLLLLENEGQRVMMGMLPRLLQRLIWGQMVNDGPACQHTGDIYYEKLATGLS